MPGRICSIDFETACLAALEDCGSSAYCRHPSFVVTTMAWAFDDAPPQSRKLPTNLPAEVAEHIAAGGVIRGWNLSFEFSVIRSFFGVTLAPEQLDDTQARAMYHGLPASLGDAGDALGLSIVKDASARRLMLQMARPRVNKGGVLRWWHLEDDAKLEALTQYCIRDVEAERAIANALPPLPEPEKRIYQATHVINVRGIKFDLPLIAKMGEIAAVVTADAMARAAEISGGVVTNPATQNDRMKKFFEGTGIVSFAKDVMPDHLGRTDLTAAQKEMLELRALTAKSSLAKLETIRQYADDAGVVRGTLKYYGAHSGRYSSTGPQMQNLARGSIKNPSQAIDSILAGMDAKGLSLFYGAPMEVLSSCIRGTIIPREGHVLIGYDFAQIEARITAYGAGQTDMVDVFRANKDIYTFAAEQIGLPSRQSGKAACIAEGTPVLTQYGWKPIETITQGDWLWDGVEWVSHGGVIFNGLRETMDSFGLPLTTDHLLLCGKSWKTTGEIISAGSGPAASSGSILSLALATGSANLPSQASSWSPNAEPSGGSWHNAPVGVRSILSAITASSRGERQDATCARSRKRTHLKRNTGDTPTFARMKRIGTGFWRASPRVLTDATTQSRRSSQDTAGGASMSSSRGVSSSAPAKSLKAVVHFWNILCRSMVGMIRRSKSIGSMSIEGMSRATFGSSIARPTRSTNGASASYKRSSKTRAPGSPSSNKKSRVYDILNAGPRHRFTIHTKHGPVIAHNCLGLGFGCGVDNFIKFAAGYGLTLSEDESRSIVTSWREANSKIVATWYALSDAAFEVVRVARASKTGSATKKVNDWFTMAVRPAKSTGAPVLMMKIPGGRVLHYRDVDIVQEERFGRMRDTLVCSGVHQQTKRWLHKGIRLYAGKFYENAVQAWAASIMINAMLAIGEQGLGDVTMSIHDEIVAEVPEHLAQERFEQIGELMSTTPEWCGDLPLAAEGDIMMRFKK